MPDTESISSVIGRQQGDGTLPTHVVKKTPHWKDDGFGKYDGPTQEEQAEIDRKNKEKENKELKKRLESVRNSSSSKNPRKIDHEPYSMSNQKKMYETIREASRMRMLDSVKPNTSKTSNGYISIPKKGGKYRRHKSNRRKTKRRKTKRRKTKRRKTNRRRSYRR